MIHYQLFIVQILVSNILSKCFAYVYVDIYLSIHWTFQAEPQCLNGDAYKDLEGNYMQCTIQSNGGNTCPDNYECISDGHLYGCCPTKGYIRSNNNVIVLFSFHLFITQS